MILVGFFEEKTNQLHGIVGKVRFGLVAVKSEIR
jgi:hypothetical protein